MSRVIVRFIYFFSILFLIVACGGGDSDNDKAASVKSTPGVSSTIPADGATNVAENVTISAQFSEDMLGTSIDGSSFSLRTQSGVNGSVNGSVTFNGASNVATFTPDDNLSLLRTYEARFENTVADLSGNPLENAYSWTFTTAVPSGWAPCGGASDKLWSWAWAGENGEYVTTKSISEGVGITYMQDLSGNGNNYFNNTGEGEPGYQVGFSEDGYSTSLPIIALDRFADGTNYYKQWMQQDGTMSANDFYLAFAGMNTRSRGNRDLWGTSESNHVWIDQEKNRVYIVINGEQHRIADTDALPKGPILLEIWRDTSGTLHTWVNGQDVSIAGVTSSDTFSMTGIMWDQGGSDYWDDYAFEFIACDSQPTPGQRDEVREYLRPKWNLYSSAVRPMKPEDLTVTQLRQNHIADNKFL